MQQVIDNPIKIPMDSYVRMYSSIYVIYEYAKLVYVVHIKGYERFYIFAQSVVTL